MMKNFKITDVPDLYRHVFNRSDEGIALLDDAGRILDANTRFKSILNIHDLKSIKTPVTEILPGIDFNLTGRETWQHAILIGVDVRLETFPPDHGGGGRIVYLRQGASANSNIFTALMENISYCKALDSIKEGVIVVGHDARILFYNRVLLEFDGFKAEDVKGRYTWELYGMQNEMSTLWKVLNTGQAILGFTQYYCRRNGRYAKNSGSSYPVSMNGRIIGAVAVYHELSDTRDAITKIVHMNRRLTESEDKDGTASRGHYCFSDIMGKSGVLKESIRRARKASVTDVSILLFGETGTGKEMFAQSIHAASSRYNHPFVAINCAAIPENLIEGILFGTRKGVYTGASDRKGLFEEANNGTLFLDEINSMPLLLQGKLLRVLEEKKVLPLGAKKELPVNVRVISSCNQDPQSLLEKQLLRSDLFYRLAVVTVQIPPLRERPNDITKLVHHFVDRFNQKLGKEIRGVAPDCMGYLKNHTWPGNVRQLKHSIEGAMSVIPDGTATLSRSHLPEYLKNGENDFQPLLSTDLPSQGLSDLIKTMEREDIVAAMVRNKGNVTRTAKELGMSRGSLHYRIKKYGIR